ncbi:hypothetical protein RchiOBHm_Chr4g0444061 [Rosa chinensis]|uniref:Uncharacterized protein n=1 Tax=Rosa chinensis TaxID=74649 RepID=A0A2P6R418_ROSCH|nr:hypothetical protein RchiOBHm_Chr4g0444061 [Rosa chinensis]
MIFSPKIVDHNTQFLWPKSHVPYGVVARRNESSHKVMIPLKCQTMSNSLFFRILLYGYN